uniref:Uncharacterized protein n=1 Tax=Leersia perrieri TaxID=77586 RepID=A0A0D9VYX8_9ORYZ
MQFELDLDEIPRFQKQFIDEKGNERELEFIPSPAIRDERSVGEALQLSAAKRKQTKEGRAGGRISYASVEDKQAKKKGHS